MVDQPHNEIYLALVQLFIFAESVSAENVGLFVGGQSCLFLLDGLFLFLGNCLLYLF